MIFILQIFIFDFPHKNTMPPFIWISPKKNPFRLDKQLVLCLQRIIVIHIMHNRILYMILILPRHCLIYMILILLRHYLIYDPESSPSLSYIWSWFFPVTVLYMILILPCHSCIWSWIFPVTVLYMILILPRHCLIYDPESSPSLSYIWSWFFPVMHCLIYDPDSSPSVPYCTRKSEVYVW